MWNSTTNSTNTTTTHPHPSTAGWNLRTVLEITDWCTLTIGFSLCVILTWLVLRHSPREQTTPYKGILLVTCAMNVLVMQIQVSKSHMEFSPDGRIYSINGRTPAMGEPWDSAAFTSIILSELLYILVAPLQALYRYLILCRRGGFSARFTKTHVWKFVVAAAVLTLVGLYLFVRLLLGPTKEQRREDTRRFESDPLWAHGTYSMFIVLFDKVEVPRGLNYKIHSPHPIPEEALLNGSAPLYDGAGTCRLHNPYYHIVGTVVGPALLPPRYVPAHERDEHPTHQSAHHPGSSPFYLHAYASDSGNHLFLDHWTPAAVPHWPLGGYTHVHLVGD